MRPKTHLFRIAQEALTNVARHSGASKVDMELVQKRWLHLVEHRGQWQRTAEELRDTPKPSVGMVGMRAQGPQAGGDFRVESPAAGGVALAAWVPMPNYSESHAIGKNSASCWPMTTRSCVRDSG